MIGDIGKSRAKKGRTASSDSQRNQVTTIGWLGAQGVGEVVEHFAETVQALNRRQELNGAAAVATGKQRRRKERRRQRLGL